MEVIPMKTVLKVLTALAAVAGTVYVIATYGDKIVAWAKKILAKFPSCSVEFSCKCGDACEGECECGGECQCEGDGECKCGGECQCENAEEAAPEAVAEEAPVEEIVIEENEPVANEEDFAE